MAKSQQLRERFGGDIASAMVDTTPADRAAIKMRPKPDKLEGTGRLSGAMMVPVSKIVPDPDQPRENIDPEALGRLAASIRGRGLLQPIRVRWDEDKSLYVIVSGERRWRACVAIGIDKIPVVEGQATSPDQVLADQLVENCVREDLSAVEQGRAIRRLLDTTGWSQNRVADELGLSRGHISRVLSILSAPEDVQAKVSSGELSVHSAYELSRVDPEKASEIASHGGDTKAVRQAAEGAGMATRSKKKSTRTYDVPGGKVTVTLDTSAPNVESYEKALKAALTEEKSRVS